MNLQYEFEGATRSLYLTDPGSPIRDVPVVLMLHGTGDDQRAWTDPASHPDHNYDHSGAFPPDRDVGWRGHPGFGVWSIELDPRMEVRSWREYLEAQGFRVAVYSQVDSVGFLSRPVAELAVVMERLRAEIDGARIAVLAQSRGGILARKFIKDNRQNNELVGLISHVVTLHSPHQGSSLALLANNIRELIADLRNGLGSVVDDALGWLEDIVDSDAFREVAVGSAFLAELSDGETALPGTEYHTFGGTSVRLTRIRSWVYSLDSAIPQWNSPPFFHRITVVELLGLSPLLDSLPDLAAELTEGRGDILVADRRSHLEFSVPRTNGINHAETLWAPQLQRQVAEILGGTPGFWD